MSEVSANKLPIPSMTVERELCIYLSLVTTRLQNIFCWRYIKDSDTVWQVQCNGSCMEICGEDGIYVESYKAMNVPKQSSVIS